jgi:pimeloyl-ACP methyl ester carboxylesterase
MDEMTANLLQKAYALIKAGNKQAAADLLIPVVRANPNLADAWFLLGHAVTEPQKRVQCFQQVLRINPNHQPAKNQLEKLQTPRPAPAFLPTKEAAPVSGESRPKAQSVPTAAKKTPRKRQSWLVTGILGGVTLLAVCACGVGLWWAFNPGAAASLLPEPSATLPPQVSVATQVLPTSVPTPSASPTPEFIPVFRGTACPFDVPLGTRVRCGVVRVPQDRTKNLTNLIELPVVLFQSSKANADVIIYLQGGPGSEAIDWSLALFDDFVTPVLKEYDMLFFDPRGTGRTQPPLDCPELNPVFIDSYFQNRSEEETFKEFNAAWEKCHHRFIAQGIDPAAFNTTQSAADVRDIAAAMGYQKVNLLGISYGTRLGLTIMRDHPEIVRAAVLDSVVPMEAKMFNRRASDVEYALNMVFSNCAASPRCNGAYPGLEKVFYDLIERFSREPVTIKAYNRRTGFTQEVKVNGVDMVSAVVWGLHTSELVPVVPKAIFDIQNGDYTFLSYALGVPGGEYNTIGMGTYFATVCPEQVYASTPQEVDADLSRSPIVKKFALAGLFGSSQRVFDLCQAWGGRAHEARDSEPVRANIPTLVISGQYDPTTPVTTGEMVAANLPDSHFYVIPGMGHGATVGNECSYQITMAFLNDPTRKPDSNCLDQEANFEFFLPYAGEVPIAVVPINDPSGRLKGVVPAGWKKNIRYPIYYRHAYLFDPTFVDYESFPGTKEQSISFLARSFVNSGFDETPRKTGAHSANGLNWTIYSSKYNGEPVMVALAEVSRGQTLGIIMVVSAPEREAFYKGLFIPILEAYAPQ